MELRLLYRFSIERDSEGSIYQSLWDADLAEARGSALSFHGKRDCFAGCAEVEAC